jgi:hypothetical protein
MQVDDTANSPLLHANMPKSSQYHRIFDHFQTDCSEQNNHFKVYCSQVTTKLQEDVSDFAAVYEVNIIIHAINRIHLTHSLPTQSPHRLKITASLLSPSSDKQLPVFTMNVIPSYRYHSNTEKLHVACQISK